MQWSSCTFQCDLYCIVLLFYFFTNTHMLLLRSLKVSRGSGPEVRLSRDGKVHMLVHKVGMVLPDSPSNGEGLQTPSPSPLRGCLVIELINTLCLHWHELINTLAPCSVSDAPKYVCRMAFRFISHRQTGCNAE